MLFVADLTPDQVSTRFAEPVFQQNMAYVQQTRPLDCSRL
jgi:hypothetical protein